MGESGDFLEEVCSAGTEWENKLGERAVRGLMFQIEEIVCCSPQKQFFRSRS